MIYYSVKESHKPIQRNLDQISSNFGGVFNVVRLVMNNISASGISFH